MKAASTSETLAATYQTARGRIPEDSSLQILKAFGTDNYMNICRGLDFHAEIANLFRPQRGGIHKRGGSGCREANSARVRWAS